LICNFGYALKQNQGKTHEQFRLAMTASFEHEINNHTYFGSWCKYVRFPKEQWQAINIQNGCKLCSRIMDAHMYLEAKAVHELLTMDDNIQMLNHDLDCQK